MKFIIRGSLPITEPQGIEISPTTGRFPLIQVLAGWIFGTVKFSAKDGFPFCPISVKERFQSINICVQSVSYLHVRDIQQDVNPKLYLRYVVLNCVTTCPQCEALIQRIGFKCGFASALTHCHYHYHSLLKLG